MCARQVAESLNRRFGMDYTGDHIFMTTGAAGALAHAVRCIAVPGQNIVTFAPFFPEYKPYVEGAGLTCAWPRPAARISGSTLTCWTAW